MGLKICAEVHCERADCNGGALTPSPFLFREWSNFMDVEQMRNLSIE